MKQPKVSVVIPVYKAEPYIEKCARTLFGQTLDDLEYIFVDDCSPDSSIDVMERVLAEYPNRKSQVKVIHHNVNQGVATARQHGVDAATGEYIIHCDPDDWIELNMYETMYNEAKAKDTDIIGCDFVQEELNNQQIKRQKLDNSGEIIFLDILRGEIYPNLWSRLIKRKLIENTHVKFVPEIHVGEDLLYLIPLLLGATKISYLQKAFYHYRMVNDSITHTFSLKHVNSVLNVIHRLKKYVIGKEKLYKAWELTVCSYAQPLITQQETYDPNRWRLETSGILKPYFGSFKNRISPWLISHNLDALNLLIIKLYRAHK